MGCKKLILNLLNTFKERSYQKNMIERTVMNTTEAGKTFGNTEKLRKLTVRLYYDSTQKASLEVKKRMVEAGINFKSYDLSMGGGNTSCCFGRTPEMHIINQKTRATMRYNGKNRISSALEELGF